MSTEIADPATLHLVLAGIGGYLIGSVPFGPLMVRMFGLGDLREIGSGNIGATNVLRTGSKTAAVLTLLFDMFKGTVAVLIFAMWGPLAASIAGICAFVGHCFPVWLKFRGGKGVATFLGVFLGLHWPTFLCLCGTWLVIAVSSKLSSLAALMTALAAPTILYFLGQHSLIWVAFLMGLVLWVRHHENIGRLIRGEEPKISFGGK